MDFTEKTIKENYIYRGKIVRLRCDDVLLPDGKQGKREVVEHNGGAAIVCVEEGKVALVRQFRYAYGEELWEIPAGKLEEGELPDKTALRELEEETGRRAGSVTLLQILYPSPGYTNEKIYIYRAEQITAGCEHLDEGEFLDVCFVPLEEAKAMIARGEIRDAKTILGILLA